MEQKGLVLSLSKGFTLIELIVVAGILTVLAGTAIVILDPVDYNRQSRDTRRVGDLTAIQGAIETAQANKPNISLGNGTLRVYISVPDPVLAGNATSTCGGVVGLPALSGGWQYHCVSTTNHRKTNGTGWLPINFDSLSARSPLAVLPIDPKNRATDRQFYTYIVQGGMTARLESEKIEESSGKKDNGVSDILFEIGKNLGTLPAVLF